MTRILFGMAFILGALAIIWMGSIFLGDDTLGFGVTVLIAGIYAIGTWELLQFRRATNTLKQALGVLAQPVDDLQQWLLTLDPTLQNSARRRIEGENNGLPAPVLTPYFVGLLVMLGLLGTFVGMVDTLKGAVVALEGNSELEAIRAGLAAPIEGLGLAFGTSVAGVAASAMLGLLSTLSRRERLQASHLLDTKLANELRHFSGHHKQQLAFQAIQDQAQALPAVVDQLGQLANSLETMGDRVSERLMANQEQFQSTVTQLYRDLNESVNQSLKTSLNEAVRSNDEIMRESVSASLEHQSQSIESLIKGVNTAITGANEELQGSSKTLLDSFADTSAQWAEQQQEQAGQLSATIRDELGRLRDDEAKRGNAAVEQLGQLEKAVTGHLLNLGQALEEPMARLIETASQTPKAAAEVIEKLRGEMTKNVERDNDLLSERTRLMEQLDTLSKTLEQGSDGQRKAIDTLIERSAETLSQVGEQFGERMEGESSKLADVAQHFASSSAEMASLSDAFNAAVTLFSESNNQLVENLTRIEGSLIQSTTRSDEQLAYYVAQAREIIDHNLLSQKEIIDAMQAQQLKQQKAQPAAKRANK